MANPQLAKKSKDGSRPGYGGIWEFVKSNWQDLAKGAAAAGKYYLDYKDQKKRNEMEQAAYDDYMAQVEAAGQEAQAAIDLNIMPMEVTNIPQTKADVSDFTAVAARGGLMNLPQRKRYAYGPNEIEVEAMDEETITPYDLKMEEGVNISEQVFHDTGNDRTNAQNVWQSGAIDQEIYQMDFEIFFKSGDWQDHISRGTVQGDTQMAKSSFNNPPFQPTQGAQDAAIQHLMTAASGGIAGLRHGGRPGYAERGFVNPQTSTEPFMAEEIIENQPDTSDMGIGEIEIYMDEKVDQPKIVGSGFQGEEKILIIETSNGGTMMITEKDYFENYGIPKYKKGGRVKRAPGGIMDLGGLEKDYRTTGGFVPIGGRERADDVPARLSKNEFVMTADAVRAAGGGSINKGAQRMYDTMKHLEASPQSNRMIS